MYEKQILEDIQIKCISNAHLIKHVAFCDQFRCIIFPWADGGDLGSFWTRGRREQTPRLVLWSLKQMLGLADALRDLHDVNCRHGDLKPGNILHFTQGDGDGTLKIADLGVSKIHKVVTNLRNNGTTTKASTPAYEGPETNHTSPDDKARSRTYDSWSLGCIMLEFVAWLLHDFPALQAFEKARDSEGHSFYRYKSVGTGKRRLADAERHSAVDKAIRCLEDDPRCDSTALGHIVGLVKDKLLVIDPRQRQKAEDLCRELRKIVTYAERDESYLFRPVDPPLVVPEIFRYVESV